MVRVLSLEYSHEQTYHISNLDTLCVYKGTQVTLTEEDADSSARSPSGETVAYTVKGRVMVMNIDGSEQTLVAANATHPAWSPDEYAIESWPDDQILDEHQI